jgi:hypothetical protein
METNIKISIGKIDIVVHEANKFIAMTWQGSTSSEIYKEACLEVLKILKKYPFHKFLYDQRNMGIISVADTKWSYEEYYPAYMKLVGKHKKSAVVVSSNAFGEFSVKNLVNGIEKTKNTDEDMLVNEYFKEREEAIKWLIKD